MADVESSTTTLVGSNVVDEAKLCPRCEDLNLTVDKFIIHKSPPTNTWEQHDYDARKLLAPSFQFKSGNDRRNFARLQDLRLNRESCRFCNLVCKAIERFSYPDARNDTVCSLSWEVDGRQLSPDSPNGFVNSTRRIRLSWLQGFGNKPMKHEVFLIFVAPKDPLRPNSDILSKEGRDKHFLGREFGDQDENQALMKSWLDLCMKEHSEACSNTHATEEKFMELISETYFGVIDVADMQLKALPVMKGKPVRYVALSYVWGTPVPGEQPYRTTRANVMTHILHGGLETAWHKLPRTIQHAILLVSRLGERYLWIDSLCIVQDSESSWRLNAQAMRLVYGHAYFTICAADGDSSTGLRALKATAGFAHPSRPLRGTVVDTKLNTSREPFDLDMSKTISADCAPGVRLMVTRPLETVINGSEWAKRGWTFQERILSRRCLIFAEGRVYFQCRSADISQDIHADTEGHGWSSDQTNSPLQTLRELKIRPIWFYIKYVNMYTSRNLTKPRDILAAFEGISQLFDRYTGAPSLFGLPVSHFDLALLWTPLEALRRRRPSAVSHSMSKCTQDEMGNCLCQLENDAFGDMEFPSWAWCGWMGGQVEYQSKLLESSLVHAHGWLVLHTWIQWHIRDEKGHVRPLWEFLSSSPMEQDTSDSPEMEEPPFLSVLYEDQVMWKGYPEVGAKVERDSSDSEDGDKVYIRHPDGEISFNEQRIERVGNAQYLRFKSGESPNKRHSWINTALNYLRRSQFSRDDDPDPDTASDPETISESGNRRRRRNRFTSKSRPEKSRDSDSEVSIAHTDDVSDSPNPKPAIRNSRNENSRYQDKYGRWIRHGIPKTMPPFQAILPDNPFGVIREENPAQIPSERQYRPILQFWTWRTNLHVAARSPLTNQSSSSLYMCSIADEDGDWCGSIALPAELIREREGSLVRLIALSEAKSFTAEECPVWTYYIPKEREESAWDLYFVLMLERNAERGVWERVGLGKVFQAAFRKAAWEEIKLG